jgi:hypothetical protein
MVTLSKAEWNYPKLNYLKLNYPKLKGPILNCSHQSYIQNEKPRGPILNCTMYKFPYSKLVWLS